MQPELLEFYMERLAQAQHKGFGSTIVGQIGDAFSGAHRRDQKHPTASARCQSLTKVMGQVKVGDDVEAHDAEQRSPFVSQELAGDASAGVGDQQADVKIMGRCLYLFEKAILTEVYPYNTIFNAEFSLKLTAQLFQQRQTTGQQHQVQPARRKLPRELLANARRGPGYNCPRAERVRIHVCHWCFSLLFHESTRSACGFILASPFATIAPIIFGLTERG